jgi:Tfp pilus assembly PilM family ATPase
MKSVSYTTRQYPDAMVSRLLLLGGGATIPGIAEHVQGIVGFECRVATPLAMASCDPAVAKECTAAMTTAAGLAGSEDRND